MSTAEKNESMIHVAQVTIEALSTCPQCTGWGALDASLVTVNDISGYGGSKTYSVTAPDDSLATPPKVCYHQLCEDSIPMAGRMKLAQDALAEAGLAPKRLVTSPGSWVEVFTETAKHADEETEGGPSDERCIAAAKLLARIHQVPTQWFDAHRAAVYVANPRLVEAAIPDASHLWIFSARDVLPGANATPAASSSSSSSTPDATRPGSDNWPPEAFKAYADLGAVMPRHPAAKRLVTVHGDYHFGNVLNRNQDQGGPIACDFEFTSAGAAVWDLSFCCACHLWSGPQRTVFLKAYLEEMGESLSESDYETFEADVALGMFPTWVSGCDAVVGWSINDLSGAAVCAPDGGPTRVKQFAEEYRASAVLRQQASCSDKGAVSLYERMPIANTTPTPSYVHDGAAGDSPLVDGGLYEIEPCHAPGTRITAGGGSKPKPGHKLRQRIFDGSSAQKFTVLRVDSEYYAFEPLCSPGCAVDNYGSAKEPCHMWWHCGLTNENQHFKLEAKDGAGSFAVIARTHGGHRWDFDVASTDEKGAKLRTWTSEEEGSNADHQQFKFIPTERMAFGGLEAVDVDFCDPRHPGKKLLSQFSAKFELNKVTAMVGQPGSLSAATAMQLLLSYSSPGAGQIMTMAGPEPERKAVVAQETSLFAGATIEECMTAGTSAYTQEELVQAARSANSLEFIQSFSDGFKTTIGEHGVQLSGSQKQRIAVARAILRKPELLFVDEDTSALDSESADALALVHSALDNLLDSVGPKCTVIVAAHRLSTLTKADTVLVLTEGRVVEQGHHAELWKRNGAYAKVISHQLQLSEGLSSSSCTSSAASMTPPPEVL